LKVASRDGRDLLVFESRDGAAHFVDAKTLSRLLRAGIFDRLTLPHHRCAC
jgi:hypothetical protein